MRLSFRLCLLLLLHPRIVEVLQQLGLLVGTQDQIHSGNLRDLLRRQLGITAGHHHEGTGVLTHHPVNHLPTFLVGHLRDTTGIDQTEVCLLLTLHLTDPHLLQHLRKRRGLREVQLTSQRVITGFLPLKNSTVDHLYFN